MVVLPGLVMAIAMEEQGECTEKIFREIQGKCLSSGAWPCGMAWRGMVLTLAGYKL